MIREEKIAELKRHREEVKNDFGWNTSLLESLDSAISALSAEGEYIKKEDAIKAFEPYRGYLSRSNDTKFVEDLKNLPTYSFPDLAENKGDLISRQAVLDELEKWDWQELYLPIHFKQILDDVSPAENNGEWIGDKDYPICSKCGTNFMDYVHYTEDAVCLKKPDFCPCCGADMRGKSCNTCKNSDDEFSGECYECVKNIQNHYEPKESEE